MPYQLDQLADNQPKLSAFFTPKSSKMLQNASTNALCRVEADSEDSSLRVGQSKDARSTGVDEMARFIKKTSVESDDIEPETTHVTAIEEPSRVRRNCSEIELAGGSNAVIKDEGNVQSELELSHQGPATSASSHCLDDQNSKESPSAAAMGPSKQCHSTSTDPNFVENYFKVVKLEEIVLNIA